MRTVWMCALVVGLAAESGASAAGTETVYQRTQSNGAVSLTNVPDGEGYQVWVAGARPDTAAGMPENTGSAVLPQNAGHAAPLDSGAAPAVQEPDPAGLRPAATPPSMEARTGKLLAPDAALSMAAVQAQQAQDEIAAAGGAQARLQSLYQASLSAFQAKRSAPQDRR